APDQRGYGRTIGWDDSYDADPLQLAGDHAKANDEIEQRTYRCRSGCARETVWSVFDNRHRRLIGFHPCACPADRGDRPNREHEADGEHGAAGTDLGTNHTSSTV